jgi:broad specificity phosphatase PhoE
VKILFVRHGEGLDDIYNEYGGWSDRELSPSGIKLAFDLSEYLKTKGYDYNLVLTSPLKRAHQTAQIISEELECRLEDCAYLKERNTYGLLSGVNKDIARKQYPRLVEAFENEEYIPGGERYEDFVLRVEKLLEHLRELKADTLVCITHGYLITTIMEEHLGLLRDKIQDGCVLEVELGEKLELVDTKGITYVSKEEPLPESKEKRRKFK